MKQEIKEDLMSNANKNTAVVAEGLNWKVSRRKRGGICDKGLVELSR